MSGVVYQFLLLILNLIIGMGNGVAFDCYRFLRFRTRLGWFWTQVTDLLFWVVSAVLVFVIYFFVTEGEARLLTILIIPIGMALYLKLVSPAIRGLLYSFLGLLGRIFWCCLYACWLLILFPLRIFRCAFSFALQFMLGLFRLFLAPFQFLLRHLRRAFLRIWMQLRRPPQAPPA